MTGYVIFTEGEQDVTGPDGEPARLYGIFAQVEARSAEHACRLAADKMNGDKLDKGVVFIAVPLRNWEGGRHTLKAETTRRIRAST
jgi:hypothetical protein